LAWEALRTSGLSVLRGEITMAEVQLGIPEALGLTSEQVDQLAEKLRNELVSMLRGPQSESTEAIQVKSKTEVV
jgi:hypothetical protein